MKLRLLLLIIPCFSFSNVLLAASSSYIQTKDGIIAFTDPVFIRTSNAVKLKVVPDNIISVVAAPGREFAATQNLVTVYNKRPDVYWNVVPSTKSFTLKTKNLTAIVDLKTGVVSSRDPKGNIILGEKQPFGRNFQPAIFDGKRSCHLFQTFQTTEDEAWYGLGQHQDGIINYKRQQVTFFQNNTEVAIPFLISGKNYGILRDNYSRDTAGERPFHQFKIGSFFNH